MTIKDFAKLYRPNEAYLELVALGDFVSYFCGKDSTTIKNALFRGGIKSMSDLYNADIEDLKRLRGIGGGRIIKVKEMKDFLDSQVNEES